MRYDAQGAVGKREHKFLLSAAPVLAVTKGGRLQVVGGKYRVTDRGIVDRG